MHGWYVVGHNNMGPFSVREIAVHLAEGLLATHRLTGGRGELYILERDPRADALAAPIISAAEFEAAKHLAIIWDGDITPMDGATLFKQTRHRDGSRSFRTGRGGGSTGIPLASLATWPPSLLADSEAPSFGREPVRLDTPFKVLCAEDQLLNQHLLAMILDTAGVDHTMVDDGAAAVRAWERESWDLILMDIEMPQMDGITATRTIRMGELTSGRVRTPIVAVTANAMAFQVAEYTAAGMDGFVPKPISPAYLLSVVRSILDTRHRPPAEPMTDPPLGSLHAVEV
jgi:CheY-like chemotaxis protein